MYDNASYWPLIMAAVSYTSDNSMVTKLGIVELTLH